MGEDYLVQIAPDSSGKQVSGQKGSALVSGVPTDTHVQDVHPQDSAGNELDVIALNQALNAISREMKLHTELLIGILNSVENRAITRADLLETLSDDGEDSEEPDAEITHREV